MNLPILDQFGRPFPPTVPKPAGPSLSAPPSKKELPKPAPNDNQSGRKRVSGLVFGLPGGIALVLTLFWSVFQFRQEISVDPYLAYDSSDPFSQRFSIVNNGPFDVHDVHYACAVTYVKLSDPLASPFPEQTTPVMMLVASHISILHWKEKISTDCDYIFRYGSSLEVIRIELLVFYRTSLWPLSQRKSWKFSAKRDVGGKFLWDYGSRDDDAFAKSNTKTVLIIPFNGGCTDFKPDAAYKDTVKLSSIAHSTGHKFILMALLPCGRSK